MKGDLSKEMVSDKGEINMGRIYVRTFVISKASLTKGWFFTRVVSQRGKDCTFL